MFVGQFAILNIQSLCGIVSSNNEKLQIMKQESRKQCAAQKASEHLLSTKHDYINQMRRNPIYVLRKIHPKRNTLRAKTSRVDILRKMSARFCLLLQSPHTHTHTHICRWCHFIAARSAHNTLMYSIVKRSYIMQTACVARHPQSARLVRLRRLLLRMFVVLASVRRCVCVCVHRSSGFIVCWPQPCLISATSPEIVYVWANLVCGQPNRQLESTTTKRRNWRWMPQSR